jgi:hypothetical protein
MVFLGVFRFALYQDGKYVTDIAMSTVYNVKTFSLHDISARIEYVISHSEANAAYR